MSADVVIRPTRAEDFDGVVAVCREVYPESPPWSKVQLESHLRVFPEGQLVAVDGAGTIIGMAASLIVRWDDYADLDCWRDFTDAGMFTNHDRQNGRTLYGAEVMVSPNAQGTGVGSRLYEARRDIARGCGLLRIRAGARLRGYHQHADHMDPERYVEAVVRGELRDPTLSFQLHHGFEVIDVVSGYLKHDPESLGYAALIEWLNPEVATAEDYAGRNPRFLSAA